MKYEATNILLVGNGSWAQKYIQTLSKKDITLKIANRDNWKLLLDRNIKACPGDRTHGVIVCTPPESHVEIASHALGLDIPTLIEKPVSLSYNSAVTLKQFTAPLLVNHIHLFSNAYQQIKQKIQNVKLIVSRGYNCGPKRTYSSLLDYGPHDISMILDITNMMPRSVNTKCKVTEIGQLFTIEMSFGKDNQTFNTVSCVGNGAVEKRRDLSIICGSEVLTYKERDNAVPPLDNVIDVFLNAVQNNVLDNRFGIDLSLKVMSVLDACQKSLDCQNTVHA